MKIEVCDLCRKQVHDFNKTEVIIKDHKGISFEFDGYFPTRRSFKGVICDACLNLLRNGASDK